METTTNVNENAQQYFRLKKIIKSQFAAKKIGNSKTIDKVLAEFGCQLFEVKKRKSSFCLTAASLGLSFSGLIILLIAHYAVWTSNSTTTKIHTVFNGLVKSCNGNSSNEFILAEPKNYLIYKKKFKFQVKKKH